MYRHGQDVEDGSVIEADLCILGAGAAGITLARSFIGRGLRVVVLESGAFDYDSATQSLYEGHVTGHGYPALDVARLRYFGGSTNHWAGECRPMREADMAAWPIGLDDLAPHYPEAFEICRFGAGLWNWDAEYWRREIGGGEPMLAGSILDYRVIQIAAEHPRAGRSFGAFFRAELEAAVDVTVILHANAVELELADADQAVGAVRVRTLAGPAWRVAARCFVLCCGGIENARLLLASNRVRPAGLGNHHDLVGRFFADHVYFSACRIATDRHDPLLERHDTNHGSVYSDLGIPDPAFDTVVDAAFSIAPMPSERYAKAQRSAGVASLSDILRSVSRRAVPDDLLQHLGRVLADLDDVALHSYGRLRYGGTPPGDGYEGIIVLNTAPDPANRVTLDDARDALGMPRARLHWHLGERERAAAERATALLGTEFGRLGIGRVQILPAVEEGPWTADIQFGYHHIGTTRMGATERDGVVDRDGRVHGTSNLFVAGSSVFPTHGSGTPTMTLVALALRLARHLEARFGR